MDSFEGGQSVPHDNQQGANNYTTTLYVYDARGRLTSEWLPPSGAANENWSPPSPVEDFNYDPAGNLVSKLDARSNLWSYTYDAENRMMTSTDPGSTDDTSHYYYDFAWPDGRGWGSSVVAVAPDSVATVTDNDMLGRHVQVSTQLLNTTYMSLTLEQGCTTYSYDILGDKTSVGVPGASTPETFTYDSFGEMTKDSKPVPPPPPGQCQGPQTNCSANAYMTANYNYSYNALGEMFKEVGPRSATDNIDPLASGTSSEIDYTYDLFGNVATVDQKGIDCPTGTSNGYCNSLTGAYPGTYSFYYDDVGNRVEALSPLAGTITQTRTWLYYTNISTGVCADSYFDLLSCSTVGVGSSQVKTTNTYSNLQAVVMAKPTQVSDPRGLTINYVYDNYRNEVAGCKGADPTCAPGSGDLQTFAYDQLGNMTAAADSSGVSTSMTYDAANRLSTVATSGGPYTQSQTTTYTYYTRSNVGPPFIRSKLSVVASHGERPDGGG